MIRTPFPSWLVPRRERALSRRRFLGAAAGVAGFSLSGGFWWPTRAWADDDDHTVLPKPIPFGIQPFGPGTEVFHLYLPDPGNEPSTIFDFNGSVGRAHITGSGKNTKTGQKLDFDNDMGIMQGEYVGVDGDRHHGTFIFF